MTWKEVGTWKHVDLELDEFDSEQMLQGLINRKWISEKEAESIMERARQNKTPKPIAIFDKAPDAEEMEMARQDMAAGRRHDAIIHLERFLGREWIGVLTAELV